MAPFKGPRLVSCGASGTTEKQWYRQVCCARSWGPRTVSRTLPQTLIVSLLKTHFFWLFQKLGVPGQPCPFTPPCIYIKSTLNIRIYILMCLWEMRVEKMRKARINEEPDNTPTVSFSSPTFGRSFNNFIKFLALLINHALFLSSKVVDLFIVFLISALTWG